MTDEFIIDFATKMFFLRSEYQTFKALSIFNEGEKKKILKKLKKSKLYKDTLKELKTSLDTKDALKRDNILKSVYILHNQCMITNDNTNANKAAELLVREANITEQVSTGGNTGTTINVIRDNSHVKS